MMRWAAPMTKKALRCAACTAQVTTSMNPSKYIEEFLAEMVELLPNSEYRKRGKCPVKEMCDAAVKRGFTNLLIFTEVALTLALTLILTPNHKPTTEP